MCREASATIGAVFGFVAKLVMVMTKSVGLNLRRVLAAETITAVVETASVSVAVVVGRAAVVVALRTVVVVVVLFLVLTSSNKVDVGWIILEGGCEAARRR